uniref:Uncharacterized protein n=1 Tax=Ciona savignyi TaxID=51511 RepID=H2Z536_CIOSA
MKSLTNLRANKVHTCFFIGERTSHGRHRVGTTPRTIYPTTFSRKSRMRTSQLEKWREEYEKASNRLDFYIHTESMCYQSNGLIKSRKPEGHLLHIDRRETVQDLLDKISSEMPSFIRKPKQMLPLKSNIEIVQKNKTTIDTLHYLKVLPHGGIHLYECASTKKDVSLYKAGVPSEAHLFAWDGKQILGWEVPFGEENAPTLIHLICHSHDFTRRASFALPPSRTLDVVKERAAQLLKSVEFEIAPETAE